MEEKYCPYCNAKLSWERDDEVWTCLSCNKFWGRKDALTKPFKEDANTCICGKRLPNSWQLCCECSSKVYQTGR